MVVYHGCDSWAILIDFKSNPARIAPRIALFSSICTDYLLDLARVAHCLHWHRSQVIIIINIKFSVCFSILLN